MLGCEIGYGEGHLVVKFVARDEDSLYSIFWQVLVSFLVLENCER
jgi:hypothetical protein